MSNRDHMSDRDTTCLIGTPNVGSAAFTCRVQQIYRIGKNTSRCHTYPPSQIGTFHISATHRIGNPLVTDKYIGLERTLRCHKVGSEHFTYRPNISDQDTCRVHQIYRIRKNTSRCHTYPPTSDRNILHIGQTYRIGIPHIGSNKYIGSGIIIMSHTTPCWI